VLAGNSVVNYKMHILFLTDNFPPEVNAPASRTFEHAKEWVRLGCSVTVITCAPNFPKGEVYSGYKNKLWQEEKLEGIRVIRVWTYMARNEGFLKRTLDYISFMISGFCASLFVRKVDVVVGTSPQFFTACSAWLSALLKRRPFVFELRDIWPESIRAVGAVKNARVIDLLEKVELFLYRRASAVIAVTKSFKENLVARGIPAEKIHIVTNGVDTSRFVSREKDALLVKRLGLEGKFVAGYIGTHGMAHALETLLDAAQIFEDYGVSEVVFLFLGDGAKKEDLIELGSKLKNVIFLDSVPKEEVVSYWSLLDVSITHLRRSELFRAVIPSKIFECMAMGIPIVHGVEGESAVIVEENEVGVTFEPENASALYMALMKIKDDPKYRETLSLNGKNCAKHFDRSNLSIKMLSVLKRL
jgi:hypothetical protein